MILGITGHRFLNHSEASVKNAFRYQIGILKPDCVITGMAVGFDQIVAEVCIEEDIPFVAAIPFKGQSKPWPAMIKEKYKFLIKKAYKRKIVSPGEYAVWKLHVRNEWIVNRSDKLLCYWNEQAQGGTYECVKYANKQKKDVINIYGLCI